MVSYIWMQCADEDVRASCNVFRTAAREHLCSSITKSHSKQAADLVDAALQNPRLHQRLALPHIPRKLCTLHPSRMSFCPHTHACMKRPFSASRDCLRRAR